MIVYFDTSALIPLVVDEPGSLISTSLWEEADQVFSTRLIVAEAAAALAQSVRTGRTDSAALPDLLAETRLMTADAILLDVTSAVVDRAADVAVSRGLRAYDAVHLATAVLVRARNVVFASGDQRLLGAARAEGFATVDTNGRPPAAG